MTGEREEPRQFQIGNQEEMWTQSSEKYSENRDFPGGQVADSTLPVQGP